MIEEYSIEINAKADRVFLAVVFQFAQIENSSPKTKRLPPGDIGLGTVLQTEWMENKNPITFKFTRFKPPTELSVESMVPFGMESNIDYKITQGDNFSLLVSTATMPSKKLVALIGRFIWNLKKNRPNPLLKIKELAEGDQDLRV